MTNKSASNQQGKISTWLAAPMGVLALLAILYILFADLVLKNVAQDALSQSNGAEVNIAALSHSLMPFGISLEGMQITDNQNAMRNKVEIAQASADIDFFALIGSKLIVEQLIVEELSFGTPRQSAGEIFESTPSAGFKFPTMEDLPSVDEVLANSPLKTTAAVAQAKQTFDKFEAPLKEQYEALPTKETLNAYKEKVAALKNVDYKNPAELISAKQTFDTLKVEIKQSLAQIKTFKALASEANAELKQSTAQLKSAPLEDYELLKGLVAGEEAAIGQITQHLFGDKAQLYTQGLLLAIDMLQQPSSNTEEEVAAPDNSGLPKVWIKDASISVNLADQTFASSWKNITDQHDLINQATTFAVNSSQSDIEQTIDFTGDFKIIEGVVNAKQAWNVKGLALKAIELIPSDADQALVANIESALVNSIGNLSINDNQISGKSNFDFSALALSAVGTSDITQSIASVIQQLSQLQLDAVMDGSLSAPSVSVSSDLDKKVLSALSASLASGDNPKLNELKTKLNEKVADQLGTSNANLDQVGSLLTAVQGDEGALEDLLKEQISNVVEDKKDELLNKLTDKLFKR